MLGQGAEDPTYRGDPGTLGVSRAYAPAVQKDKLERYEDLSQRPLTWLAVVFLVVYGLPIVDTSLPPRVSLACTAASWAVWAIFATDYAVRALLSERAITFVRQHLLELVAVVLPMLRPLRALRILSLANLAARLDEEDGIFVNAARAVAMAVGLLVLIGSLAMLDAERDAPGASITSFGDSLWWAVVTITTVGYGDMAPVTLEGRLIATVMMFLGIALVGVVTAGIATWAVTYLQRNRPETDRGSTASD